MAAAVKSKDWAEEDEFGLPPREEVIGEDGLKRVTEWTVNSDYYAVKTEKLIRLEKIQRVVSEGVAKRMQWAKYGESANAPRGLETGVSTPSPEEINIDWIVPKDEDEEDQQQQDTVKKDDIRRLLAADRMRRRAQEREAGVATWAQLMAIQAGADKNDLESQQKGGVAPGKYVPPSLRGRDGASMPEAGGRDDSTTVRVSNLPPKTTEADLHVLFKPFGRVQRIFLSRDRVTNESKGFAYVAFDLESDAQRAIDGLDGHGYDYLILRVEWAQQNKGKGGG
eukprot:CAMPEP_0184700130 /NCGR_PEP_ID=MMETSP0313-20130426/8732_1 /TAXON_ID=2792 /ORGANISM="Porphyridium aerugineum, Strain SAG 1380-2" /LENGTH=280 /DNA_ID=CAMNT_0027159553 /DNA_START=13 /DNA_END=851 /DNA_ORIENTATION=+